MWKLSLGRMQGRARRGTVIPTARSIESFDTYVWTKKRKVNLSLLGSPGINRDVVICFPFRTSLSDKECRKEPSTYQQITQHLHMKADAALIAEIKH